MKGNEVIITGIPRSGTTLTCHLLNKVSNTVALHEPMQVHRFPDFGGHEKICMGIMEFFKSTRRQILEEKRVECKQIDGEIPDNTIGGYTIVENGIHLRTARASKGIVSFNKDLSEDFVLAVKHPSAFTALLPTLRTKLRCYAVIRNPLAILSSWNSVKLNPQRGHAPGAERLDDKLRKDLSKIDDRIDRQLFLLSWFFRMYVSELPLTSILKYEDIVESGGQVLAKITENAMALDENLVNKNSNKLYDSSLKITLAEKLLKSDGAYWEMYNRNEILDCLKS